MRNTIIHNFWNEFEMNLILAYNSAQWIQAQSDLCNVPLLCQVHCLENFLLWNTIFLNGLLEPAINTQDIKKWFILPEPTHGNCQCLTFEHFPSSGIDHPSHWSFSLHRGKVCWSGDTTECHFSGLHHRVGSAISLPAQLQSTPTLPSPVVGPFSAKWHSTNVHLIQNLKLSRRKFKTVELTTMAGC